jgi:hypothetical protein
LQRKSRKLALKIKKSGVFNTIVLIFTFHVWKITFLITEVTGEILTSYFSVFWSNYCGSEQRQLAARKGRKQKKLHNVFRKQTKNNQEKQEITFQYICQPHCE